MTKIHFLFVTPHNPVREREQDDLDLHHDFISYLLCCSDHFPEVFLVLYLCQVGLYRHGPQPQPQVQVGGACPEGAVSDRALLVVVVVVGVGVVMLWWLIRAGG